VKCRQNSCLRPSSSEGPIYVEKKVDLRLAKKKDETEGVCSFWEKGQAQREKGEKIMQRERNTVKHKKKTEKSATRTPTKENLMEITHGGD